MEDYLFKHYKNINEENSTEQGIELYNKSNKKRKIKANEIQVKEFFSDDDNDENEKKKKKKKIGLISKYTNQRKINFKKDYKYSKNSILIYKEQLYKKSTIDQTPNKKRERQNILIEDITSKDTAKDKPSKKVTFMKDNFVEYINVESYKIFNSSNTNKEPHSEDKIKNESKCCLIY